jgi:hypothetical protein
MYSYIQGSARKQILIYEYILTYTHSYAYTFTYIHIAIDTYSHLSCGSVGTGPMPNLSYPIFLGIITLYDDDDDDVHLRKITTRVSQNLILHKNADQPKA